MVSVPQQPQFARLDRRRWLLYLLTGLGLVLASWSGVQVATGLADLRSHALVEAERTLGQALAARVEPSGVSNSLRLASRTAFGDSSLGLFFLKLRNADGVALLTLSDMERGPGAFLPRGLEAPLTGLLSAEANRPLRVNGERVGYAHYGVAWRHILVSGGVSLWLWLGLFLTGLLLFVIGFVRAERTPGVAFANPSNGDYPDAGRGGFRQVGAAVVRRARLRRGPREDADFLPIRNRRRDLSVAPSTDNTDTSQTDEASFEAEASPRPAPGARADTTTTEAPGVDAPLAFTPEPQQPAPPRAADDVAESGFAEHDDTGGDDTERDALAADDAFGDTPRSRDEAIDTDMLAASEDEGFDARETAPETSFEPIDIADFLDASTSVEKAETAGETSEPEAHQDVDAGASGNVRSDAADPDAGFEFDLLPLPDRSADDQTASVADETAARDDDHASDEATGADLLADLEAFTDAAFVGGRDDADSEEIKPLGDETLDLRLFPIWRGLETPTLVGARAGLVWRRGNAPIEIDSLVQMARQRGQLEALVQWMARRFATLLGNWRMLELPVVPLLVPVAAEMFEAVDGAAIWTAALDAREVGADELIFTPAAPAGSMADRVRRARLVESLHDLPSAIAPEDLLYIDDIDVVDHLDDWRAALSALGARAIIGPLEAPQALRSLIEGGSIGWFDEQDDSALAARAFAQLLTTRSIDRL